MIEALLRQIDKALATETGDHDEINFRYFRKLDAKATKLKPLELRADLFMNPDYGIVWCLVSNQ